MFMKPCDDLIIDRLDKREAELWQQSGALDLKASILLVAITFLAGQSSFLLSKQLHGANWWLQIGSLVLQFIAGILCAAQLAIIRYRAEFAEKFISWRDGLICEKDDQSQAALQSLRDVLITSAEERIKLNMKRNDAKADIATWCYWLTMTAFACNVLVAIRYLV